MTDCSARCRIPNVRSPASTIHRPASAGPSVAPDAWPPPVAHLLPIDRAMLPTRTILLIVLLTGSGFAQDQTRPSDTPAELERWLQNMVWHHRYTPAEIQDVTGLDADQLEQRLQQFQIRPDNAPARPDDRLLVLPYPGGRHPRIGFLDGAVAPQRETKLSVFCPWDDRSYAVLDVPEAIWSNLGLTYLAHTHIDTIWSRQGITLPQQEWRAIGDGGYVMQRRLPNGVQFGTRILPHADAVRMEMWLTNGTPHTLSDLRVQNCVMLKGAVGFAEQTNENKSFDRGYAIAWHTSQPRWMITAWDPVHRPWANAPCPCLHSDPKFDDCPPGETRWLRGWFSFFEGDDITAEIDRIEATGWRTAASPEGNITGSIVDADTNEPLPARLSVRSKDTQQFWFADSVGGTAVRYDKQLGQTASIEKHTALTASPFRLQLPVGEYEIHAQYGKEFLPVDTEIRVTDPHTPLNVRLPLQRFTSMAQAGWYSGDTHVHRDLQELPTAVLAEDLNVALPLTHWVRDSADVPATSGPAQKPVAQYVDSTHVIYPVNTEYEIFTVDGQRHTQGAVFVLNHQRPLRLPAPPVQPVAVAARQQGAILDLDKHSWNWSLMIVPVMKVDLFELTNNHHWRTQFGFPQWTIDNAPDWPEIERDERGFTEAGWTEFGLQTYYTLLNCGFRMRVSGGTASGVHPVPLGHGRVYVHCGTSFSYDNWIANLNAGHSFVTQGPLLNVRFNGQLPGHTWTTKDDTQETVVTGTIDSVHPLTSVELIVNGRVVQQVDPQCEQTPSGSYRTQIGLRHQTTGSAWLAVRCFEQVAPHKTCFAHTNPVFVDVAGAPVRPRPERVRFFVERMEDEIRRNTGILSESALQEFRRARDIYTDLSNQAKSTSPPRP